MVHRTRKSKTEKATPARRPPNVSTPSCVKAARASQRPLDSPVAPPQYVGLRTLWAAGDPIDNLTPANLMSWIDLAKRGDIHRLMLLLNGIEMRDVAIAAHLSTRRSGVLACGIEVHADEQAADKRAAQEATDLVKEHLRKLDVSFAMTEGEPAGPAITGAENRTGPPGAPESGRNGIGSNLPTPRLPYPDQANVPPNYPSADPLRAPLDGQPGEIAFRQGWKTSLMVALDAIGKEFSAQEMIWDTSSSEWRVAQLAWRPQWWFHLGGFNLRLRDLSIQGMPLNPLNFMVHRQQSVVGVPGVSGLLCQLLRPYLIKNFSWKVLVGFQELFGQPLRVGTYQAGWLDEQKDELMRSLMGFGTNAWAMVREGANIEVKDSARGAAGASTIFERTIALCDSAIELMVLGQNNATSTGGSFAKAQVLDRIRFDKLNRDAGNLEATLEAQLFGPIVRLNLGDVPIPKAVIPRREPLDVLGTLKSYALGAQMGIAPGRKWARQQIGWPEPGDDDRPLVAPPTGAIG